MMQVAFTIAMLVTVGLLVYVAFLAFSGGDDLSFGTHSDQSSDEESADNEVYFEERKDPFESVFDPHSNGSYSMWVND